MASEEDIWYKNISKNNEGIDVNVMDLFEKEIKEITASSNNTTNILKNIADNNPLTQWSTRYETITLDDDFYVNRKVTKGSYSRGSIVKDGSNKQNVNDYLMGIYQSRDTEDRNYSNEINKLKNTLKDLEKNDLDMNKQDTDFRKTQSVYIGSSNSNTKYIKVSNDAIDTVNKSLKNSFDDTFKLSSVYTHNNKKYFYVKRTDYGGGWGDRSLHATIYVIDRDALNNYNKQKEQKKKQQEEANKIKIDISEIEAKLTSEINNLNSKISNKQEYINNLPFKVRDDGKYTGDKQTILINGSIIKGEWIDIILKSKLLINKYELLPGKREENGNLQPFPKDFYLLGTNNNKWEIIDSHFDYTPVYYDDNTPIPFTLKNKKRYERIRLVISSLNPSTINYNGLGSLSLSIFNLYGNKCYTINNLCETFQPYINKKNMSKIEGLTMMDQNIQVLEDLKKFSEKYNKYVTCSDITLPENIRAGCSDEDKNIDTVNNAYNKLTPESITKLQNTPLNNFSTVAEYETTHNEIIKKHKEIVPLRKELDEKLRQLNAEEESMLNDYKLKYDNTMYTSLVLSVVLTSSLYFIFRKL